MRDYTGPNINYVKHYINTSINNTNHDYRNSYINQRVPFERRNLKYDSLCVGSDANSHIRSIRDRLSEAMFRLELFYSNVDTVSSVISSSADSIVALLDEVNGAMDRINNALSGLGDYQGKTVSAKNIREAGINEATCAKLKEQFTDSCANCILYNIEDIDQYIDEMKALKDKNGTLSPEEKLRLKYLFDWYAKIRYDQKGFVTNLSEQDLRRFVDVFKLLDSDDLTDDLLNKFMKNDAAVALYLEDMKALEGDIPQEDLEKLKKIYHWYADNRFDSNNNDNILKFSDQALQNGIDVFELLCPDAKNTTNTFFSPALDDSDPNVQKNILRIKFGIYTASPQYRDVILYYMPDMHLGCYKNSPVGDWYAGAGGFKYFGYTVGNYVNTDLSKDYTYDHYFGPFGSFFHEFGHGIDDVTKGLGNSSADFNKYIKEGFEDSIDKTLERYNAEHPSDPLTPEDMEKLKKFMLGDENNNVLADPDNPDSYLTPPSWDDNPKLKDAYNYMRNYYGYAVVYFDKNGIYHWKNGSDGDPLFKSNDYSGAINSDIFGALTNNKVGLARGGHYAPWMKDTPALFPDQNYNNAVLQIEMDTYPYWYLPGGFAGMEFFAESFNMGVQRIDSSPTKIVFGKAYDCYDQKMKEVYKNVPHIDI